jgi:hypothetical protein
MMQTEFLRLTNEIMGLIQKINTPPYEINNNREWFDNEHPYYDLDVFKKQAEKLVNKSRHLFPAMLSKENWKEVFDFEDSERRLKRMASLMNMNNPAFKKFKLSCYMDYLLNRTELDQKISKFISKHKFRSDREITIKRKYTDLLRELFSEFHLPNEIIKRLHREGITMVLTPSN